MPLEHQIIEWTASRPTWQKSVLKRVATGNLYSEEEYDRLADDLCLNKPFSEVTLEIKDLPHVEEETPPVRLISIADPEHVNALSSKNPLTIGVTGLTIIYGDNASGKSGYARLLKRIAQARHQEEVLTDVFRDNGLEKPTAVVTVQIGEDTTSQAWPESSIPELKHMRFYDEACSRA